MDLDSTLRAAAFAYLDEVVRAWGPWVRREQLESFTFRGQRLPLIARQRGIWKPQMLEAALSILTTYTPPNQRPPYVDDIGADGYPRYKWRGTDAHAWDNVALRRAMKENRPLIWFVGISPGIFDAVYPVWLVDEEPSQHQFVLALDDVTRVHWEPELTVAPPFHPTRRYAEVLVRTRLHQPVFRARVLIAYGTQCALCRLRHRPLLDAAHIKEDAEGGEPFVSNGISMCAIHHRAFDANVLGLRPNYKVEIRKDVLEEHDGPTLRHALQGLHGSEIFVPHRRAERPDPDLLEERYERFRVAS